MEIILNTNELGYLPFLEKKVDSFVIGLKDYCINQKYSLNLKDLKLAITDIKSNNKKVYVSINMFALERDIARFKKIAGKLKDLNADGFIVSDLGIVQVLKNNGLIDKVIIDLQTYVTNKYSALSLLNLGVKRVVISKEITLEDIKEISLFLEGKVEVLVQGYIPITHSKRNILSCYYKNIKENKKDSLHFLKEESRENYYLLNEDKDNLTVYNDKEYSLFNYLPDLLEVKINHFKIDTNFLSEKEINEYIDIYNLAFDALNEGNLKEYEGLKNDFNKKYIYDNPFLHNQSVLLKGGDK